MGVLLRDARGVYAPDLNTHGRDSTTRGGGGGGEGGGRSRVHGGNSIRLRAAVTSCYCYRAAESTHSLPEGARSPKGARRGKPAGPLNPLLQGGLNRLVSALRRCG
jgi:hypothetical protein